MISKEQVLSALSNVDDPDLKKDIVTLGMVENLIIDGSKVQFDLVLTTPACPMKEMLVNACHNAIKYMVDTNADVQVNATSRVQKNQRDSDALPHVKHLIAVASGKGGVGKSTLSATLALALKETGAKVGLLDADIYGPSIPTLFNVHQSPVMVEKEGKSWMIPIESHGIKLLSIGFMTAPGQAVVWRGPMISSAFRQFIHDVEWGELDYLIVDLPPGTGDVQITLSQQAPLTGVVLVTTPQEMALTDARRAVDMFQLDAIKKPIIGVVENMSYFTPDDAPDKKYRIFGEGGGAKIAAEYNLNFLGELPLNPKVMQNADSGNWDFSKPEMEPYMKVAKEIARSVSIMQMQRI
jgi:ATP-binding protein involved in chromosome partitioning